MDRGAEQRGYKKRGFQDNAHDTKNRLDCDDVYNF